MSLKLQKVKSFNICHDTKIIKKDVFTPFSLHVAQYKEIGFPAPIRHELPSSKLFPEFPKDVNSGRSRSLTAFNLSLESNTVIQNMAV